MRLKSLVAFCGALILSSCAATPDQAGGPSARVTFLQAMFDSPQKGWIMLCNNRELSIGVRNDATTLFVKAIVWNDGDGSLGLEPSSRQPIGDHSTLMIHLGDGAARTAGRDLDVVLNPWPQIPGIRVSRHTSGTTTTTLQEVSGASGSINYVQGPDGKATRTDEYVLPLSGLGLEQGMKISAAFYASSAVPGFTTSCVTGFERGNFYPTAIPAALFARITLQTD